MSADKGPLTDEELDAIQFTTVQYYLHEINPYNGLVRDKTWPDAPASIAACGMALASMPLFVERLLMPRELIAKRVRNHLKYLWELPQGPEPELGPERQPQPEGVRELAEQRRPRVRLERSRQAREARQAPVRPARRPAG